MTHPRSLSKEWQVRITAKSSNLPISLKSTIGHCLAHELLILPWTHDPRRVIPSDSTAEKWRKMLAEMDRGRASSPPSQETNIFLRSIDSFMY